MCLRQNKLVVSCTLLFYLRTRRVVATVTQIQQLNATELVNRFQAGIWRYLRYLGCEVAQADDLTQETFLAVIRKPFDHRSDQETASYLRKAARNQFLMAIRKRRKGPTLNDLQTAEEVWASVAAEGSNDYLDALDECLEALNGRPLQVIHLQYRDNQSRQSIAGELGMSEDGVKTLLRRTRARLRECVKRRLGNE